MFFNSINDAAEFFRVTRRKNEGLSFSLDYCDGVAERCCVSPRAVGKAISNAYSSIFPKRGFGVFTRGYI